MTMLTATEPSNWWAATSKWFAEVAPEVQILVVSTPTGVVTVLSFDTERSPYLVTTRGADGVDREVPWRAGNRTRSAHRAEILRSVVGEAMVPRIEIITGQLRIERGTGTGYGDAPNVVASATWHATAYVECTEPVRLPQHKWEMLIKIGGHDLPVTSLYITGPTSPAGSSPSGAPRLKSAGSIEAVHHLACTSTVRTASRFTGEPHGLTWDSICLGRSPMRAEQPCVFASHSRRQLARPASRHT